MKKLARILIGAGIGCAIATAFLVVLIFCMELAYTRGLRYDDMDLAYVSWGILVTAPIVGGWYAWVRS
jgi:hypothetical protein